MIISVTHNCHISVTSKQSHDFISLSVSLCVSSTKVIRLKSNLSHIIEAGSAPRVSQAEVLAGGGGVGGGGGFIIDMTNR